jgi:hypothetical protein
VERINFELFRGKKFSLVFLGDKNIQTIDIMLSFSEFLEDILNECWRQSLGQNCLAWTIVIHICTSYLYLQWYLLSGKNANLCRPSTGHVEYRPKYCANE